MCVVLDVRVQYSMYGIDECAFILGGEEIAELPVRSKRASLSFRM